MRHEAENLRRVGRDEMNLAEFPIASLAERIPPGCKTMAFEDQHGRLTVIGSDAYGLPTALDSDVIVGLLHLTKQRNDFTDPAVEFSRYELLELLGWTDQGWSYRRLTESLHRWVTVTLKYDGSWWDHKQKRRTSASFHILDRLVVPDEDDSRIVSSFTWGKDFFDSCRDGNLKRLDLTTYFTLKSSLSKQLYRFLDKRFHVRREWDLDLRELAHERIGMSRKYAPWKVKQVLQPILEELEEISFLESLPAADRYIKVGRGDWKIRLVRKLPPSAEPPLLALVEPTGLEKELVERGVTPSVATALVRDVPEERIQRHSRSWIGSASGGPRRSRTAALSDQRHPPGLRAAGRFPEPGRAGRGRGGHAGGAGPAGADPPGEGPGARRGGPAPGLPGGADPRRAGAAGRRGVGTGRSH